MPKSSIGGNASDNWVGFCSRNILGSFPRRQSKTIVRAVKSPIASIYTITNHTMIVTRDVLNSQDFATNSISTDIYPLFTGIIVSKLWEILPCRALLCLSSINPFFGHQISDGLGKSALS